MFIIFMMDLKGIKEISRSLPLIAQMGISVVVPIVLCLIICYWLTDRFGAGSWVYIPGFVFGLGSAFMSVYKVYLSEKKKNDKKEKKIAFNNHG